MIPDDIVGFLERCILVRINQVFELRHKFRLPLVSELHAADTIILIRHNASTAAARFPLGLLP